MNKPLSPAQIRWQSSEEFRSIGSASAKANLRRFALAPKCGAKARSTGEPCKLPGLGAGGRCRFHGGASPSGRQWHRVQWADMPLGRFYRKLAKLQRSQEARRKRVAAMTPEERARYDAWLAAHEPSTPGKRATRREDRRRSRELRDDLERFAARPAPPISEELQRITAAIEALKAEIARQEADASLELEALDSAAGDGSENDA